MLSLVLDGLACPGLSEAGVCDLIHAADIMMRNAPEGMIITPRITMNYADLPMKGL